MKIKTGDKVLITNGKNRGKTGKVTHVLPEENRVVVDGVNMQKKHVRPKKQGEQGQIVEVASPIAASNAKLICTKCDKPTRVGYKIEGGEKYRICKRCGKTVNK
ncbi:MAG: 50S ribosomal protein L24 [Candidatus Spechtbacterales bacterium]|nr:50S ribosomal protein L24 [Candidatus Spechtbacterales bacterium]